MSDLKYCFKICLLGNSRSGKSSYINKLLGKNIIDMEPTIGVDFNCHIISRNNNKYKFQIYDTSGLSNFYNITSNYYDITNIFFIFCDSSNYNDNNIIYWYNEILNHRKKNNGNLKDLKIILILNNFDLLDNKKKEKMEKMIKSKLKISDIYFISVINNDLLTLEEPLNYIIEYYSRLIKAGIVDDNSVKLYNLKDEDLNTPLIEKPTNKDDFDNTRCKCNIL
jgi:small GTP-binding protein